MTANDPIDYTLEIRDLGPNGHEVVVSVVNTGEDWLWLRKAEVLLAKDGQPCGRHEVSFLQKRDAKGLVRLGQFEIAEGHFHLARDLDHRLFDFRVEIDYRYGDHEVTQRLERRVDTKRISR
jgi:hypothetical protein